MMNSTLPNITIIGLIALCGGGLITSCNDEKPKTIKEVSQEEIKQYRVDFEDTLGLQTTTRFLDSIGNDSSFFVRSKRTFTIGYDTIEL